MVHIFSVMMFRKDKNLTNPVLLLSVYELSPLSFFQRGTAKEFLRFVSREMVKRIESGGVTIEHKEHLCNVRVLPSGLCCAALTDKDYPSRVAFSFIEKCLEGFSNVHGAAWRDKDADVEMNTPQIMALLQRYQMPESADPMLKLQGELAATQDVLKKTIGDVIDRGEKLDELAQQSADLSFQAKALARTTDEMNCSCTIL